MPARGNKGGRVQRAQEDALPRIARTPNVKTPEQRGRRYSEALLNGRTTPYKMAVKLAGGRRDYATARVFQATAQALQPPDGGRLDFSTVIAAEVLTRGHQVVPQDAALRDALAQTMSLAASRAARLHMCQRLEASLAGDQGPRLLDFVDEAAWQDRLTYVRYGLKVAKVGAVVAVVLPLGMAGLLGLLGLVIGGTHAVGSMALGGLYAGCIASATALMPVVLAGLAVAAYYTFRENSGTA